MGDTATANFCHTSSKVEKIKHLGGECFNPINIYLSLREIGVCVCVKLGLLYLKRTVLYV